MAGRAQGPFGGGRCKSARDLRRHADPVLPELIDARPDFHPRAWLNELAPLCAMLVGINETEKIAVGQNSNSLRAGRLKRRVGASPRRSERTVLDGENSPRSVRNFGTYLGTRLLFVSADLTPNPRVCWALVEATTGIEPV